MPRQRLPWFKVWVGATRHEKVATLDDKTFRAWVELLDAASQQTIRGHFASTAAAASVIRRPLAMVKVLSQARLIDQLPDGSIQMHDWPDWQRWRPEDASNNPEPPPESHTKDSGITPERLRNNNGIARENYMNDTPPRVERAKTEKKTEKREEDVDDKTRDVTPSATTSLSPKGAAAAFSSEEQSRVNSISETLAAFGISREPKVWRKVLDDYGQLDLEAEALKQADWMRRHRIKACSTARYLNWLDKAREDYVSRSMTNEPAVVTGCPRCGKANWDTSIGPVCPQCARHDAPVESSRARPPSSQKVA